MSVHKEHGDLLEELKDKFLDKMSPSLVRSRLFWQAVERVSRSRLTRPQWKADRVSLDYLLKSSRDAYLKRAPVVWSNLLVPSELILGLGCIPFYPEMGAALTAAAGLAPRFIDRSAEIGFSPDSCSYHRCILGCSVDGFFPEPDLLLALNYPCDSATLSFGYLAGIFDAPRVVIDVPMPGRPSSHALLALQFEGAARKMASLSGMSDREMAGGLGRAIELSNQALGYMRGVEELRRRDDCTLDGQDALNKMSVLLCCLGSEAGVEFYHLLGDELRERGCTGHKSRRLMWMHLKPWYSRAIFDILDEHDVRVVCEEYAHSCWEPMDPRRPFDSLATKVGGHFLVGPLERRDSYLSRLAEDYRIDGAIHYNHWGCRQSCGGAVQIKQSLQRKGIPTLLLDGDCCDPREFQEGQVSTRLEAFLESLN